MKAGDLIRYKGNLSDLAFKKPPDDFLWKEGLLLEFDQIQRLCVILDNSTGEIIKRHCSDVQLVKVGHASR